jgi:PAS domain S-box-containing protein
VNLLHARVRAVGACELYHGERGAILGVRLFTQDLSLITVIEPASDTRSLTPIRDLPLARPNLVSPRRVRVQGTVTCAVPNGPVFVQSNEEGLEVALVEPRMLIDAWGATVPSVPRPDLKLGDRVIAEGYPAARGTRTILDEAELRVVGTAPLEAPIHPTSAEWNGLGPDCRRVEIRGHILHALPPPGDGPDVVRFAVQSDDTLVEVRCLATNLPALETEARVRLVGVASAEINELGSVNGWRLWVPAAENLELVARPWPDFSPATQRLLLAAGGIVVALAGWALFLWRQLGRKSLQNVELEGRIAERTRELQGTNASLRREITERIKAETLQSAIYRISEATHSVGDLPELYRQLHEIIGTLMPARNFYIALDDRATDRVTFPYYADERSEAPRPRPPSHGLTEFVISTREPLLADENRLAALEATGVVAQIGPRAKVWLGVPLLVHGRATGVMAVQDYFNAEALNSEHQQILTYVAGQTATAIERKRAEAALRASQSALRSSQQRFRSAFASNPAIMTLARLRDGALFEVNDAFLAVTGYLREEVLGRSTVDLGLWVHVSDRDTIFEEVRSTGFVRGREVAVRLRDGRVRTVLLAAELVEIDGEPSILAASLDLTERKEVEQQLRRALAREKELGELKSNFVSLVSHEFRTPLEVILSSSEIIERYHDRLAPDQRGRQVAAIQRSVRRMAEMMNEILLLGRFEAGRVEFSPGPLDLATFQRRMRDEIGAASGGNGITIELATEGDVAEARGDEGLLGHIFTNLLSNAVKYSPPGSTVRFAVHRSGIDAVFEVTDHGCGIPEGDQRRLFQSFHRGSNVGERSGTGLGLVIVKRCVDRHGGIISFTSGEGCGTSFTVRLPLFQPIPPAGPRPGPSEDPIPPFRAAAITP